MPIYEYQCQECGHELEAIQRLADDPLTECPACAKPALKKRVSAPSFRLSGGGWYETDFKTGDKKNIAGERGDTARPAVTLFFLSGSRAVSAPASPRPLRCSSSAPW